MQNSRIQNMLQNFYANMYAWAAQRASEKPHLREYYEGRQRFYEKLMLQSTNPITIEQILQ